MTSKERAGALWLPPVWWVLLEVEGLDAEELGGFAQLFLDAEKLVVLADAVGAAGGAGLDLAGPGG